MNRTTRLDCSRVSMREPRAATRERGGPGLEGMWCMWARWEREASALLRQGDGRYHSAMTSFHLPPRHPHALAWLFAASQLAVIVIWWLSGCQFGLAALLVSHLTLVWATLRPQSRLLSPVLTRL